LSSPVTRAARRLSSSAIRPVPAYVEQRAEAGPVKRLEQRGLDRTVGRMQPAQLVPFGGITGKISLGGVFACGADRGEVAAVLGAARGELGVVLFGRSEQAGGGGAQRRRAAFADRAAQEHPGAFLAPFGQPGIAQDPDVPGYAWLALPQHQGQFAHGQLHRGEQAHDPQPRRVSQGAKGGFDLHCSII
jgi:hypothetical protein